MILYYALGIFGILYELSILLKPVRAKEFFVEYSRKMRAKEDISRTDKEKVFGILMTFYLLWNALGLLTFQWITCAFFFIYSMLMSSTKRSSSVLIWIDALISLIVITWLIINGVHLKIDIWSNLNMY